MAIWSDSVPIVIANLIRSADLLANWLTQMRGATPPRLILELVCGQMMLPQANDAAVSARLEKLERGVISSTPPVEVKAAKSEPIQNTVKAEPKIEVKPVVAEVQKSDDDLEPLAEVLITFGDTCESLKELQSFWKKLIPYLEHYLMTWSLLHLLKVIRVLINGLSHHV